MNCVRKGKLWSTLNDIIYVTFYPLWSNEAQILRNIIPNKRKENIKFPKFLMPSNKPWKTIVIGIKLKPN